MRKLICFILVVLLAVSLAACAEDLETKFEKQVKADVEAAVNHEYLAYDLEATVRKIEVDGEYYYATGKVTFVSYDNGNQYTLGTDFEGKYKLRSDNTFAMISLDIEMDDWEFV